MRLPRHDPCRVTPLGTAIVSQLLSHAHSAHLQSFQQLRNHCTSDLYTAVLDFDCNTDKSSSTKVVGLFRSSDTELIAPILDNATSVRDDATGKSFSIRCVQSNMLLQGLNRKPSYKRVFQSSSLEQKQESDCQQQSRLFDARLCMCLPPSHHPF